MQFTNMQPPFVCLTVSILQFQHYLQVGSEGNLLHNSVLDRHVRVFDFLNQPGLFQVKIFVLYIHYQAYDLR